MCGCTALVCCCIECDAANGTEKTDSSNSTENQTITTTATANINETTTINGNETITETNTVAAAKKKSTTDKLNNFNVDNLPKPIRIILHILSWALWVFLPLIGTALITNWLYKTDAIRIRNNELYAGALSLFVCALLNLMVYLQTFIDSLWKFVSEKVCGTKSKKKIESEETDELNVV